MPQNPSLELKTTITRYGKLLADLTGKGVDFAVVGGLAVIFNGYPRMTFDVDILVHKNPENLRKLLDSLTHWGEGFARELRVEDFTAQEGAIRVMEDFDLDIFVQLQGKTLDDFRPRLNYLQTGGAAIPYLSASDIIDLKKNSHRQKDQFDVQAMKEILAGKTHPPRE